MRDSLVIKILLYPFSLVYGAVVVFRNWLFDIGVLCSEKFPVNVICVGNITVGGTGKTPFTEYLIRLLKDEYKIGVLSRGYKRKTSGYILADSNSGPSEVGDEPCQMKRKFPDVEVGVDSNRRRGIRKMLTELSPKPEIFILDDAFQHRYVETDIAIMLVDYNRMITDDLLLPAGNLREPVRSKNRANIVVVTKCPSDIKPIEFRIIAKKLKLYPYQKLYFTTLKYDAPKSVFGAEESLSMGVLKESRVLSVTGIANPIPFEKYLKSVTAGIDTINFSDHHNFSKKDYSNIVKKFNDITAEKKLIITTEKDAVRLRYDKDFPEELKKHFYYIPMCISFLEKADAFDKQIKDYVAKNNEYKRYS